jgi:hypothetical protein
MKISEQGAPRSGAGSTFRHCGLTVAERIVSETWRQAMRHKRKADPKDPPFASSKFIKAS